MRRKILTLGMISTLFVYTSCENDPCDDGYTQVKENGATYCLPDYIAGIERNNNFGNKFYHPDLGIIEYKNNNWYSENYQVLENLNGK
jgi:hypothetical protein